MRTVYCDYNTRNVSHFRKTGDDVCFRKRSKKKRYYLIVRREDKLKDDHQSDEGRLAVMETKCHEEFFSANQNSKKEEAEERVHL